MKYLLFTTVLSTLTAVSAAAECKGLAHYRVTLEGTWTPESANAPVPEDAYFGPAFATIHSDRISLYQRWERVTPGVQFLIETGATSIVENDAGALVATREIKDTAKGTRLGPQEQHSLHLIADEAFHRLSLAAMLAPSPDWFVGLSGFELCQDGQWVEGHAQALTAYDAGTDAGKAFGAADDPMSPQGVVEFLSANLGWSSHDDQTQFARVVIEKI